MSEIENIQSLASILSDVSTTVIFLLLYMREREAVKKAREMHIEDLRATINHERTHTARPQD